MSSLSPAVFSVAQNNIIAAASAGLASNALAPARGALAVPARLVPKDRPTQADAPQSLRGTPIEATGFTRPRGSVLDILA